MAPVTLVCRYVVLAYVVHKDETASFLVGGSCNPYKLHVHSTRLRKYVTIIGLVIIGVTRVNMELGACYEDILYMCYASNPFNNLHIAETRKAKGLIQSVLCGDCFVY